LKKVPERTCIGCGNTRPKNELIRIVRDNENNVFVDLTGKKNGRGAYICQSEDCLKKAIKSNRLAKMFEIDINQKIYEDLRDVIASIPEEN